jgi:hypothetical protein
VATLVAHGDIVLFSAAIPFQGGAGHVNEQWPTQWAARFATHGFVPLDVVRPAVWNDDRVAFWYAQNTVLYVHESRAAALGVDASRPEPLRDLVHPALHVRDHTRRRVQPPPSLRRVLRDLPGAATRAIARTGRRSGRRPDA